jgi:hypothetical protein
MDDQLERDLRSEIYTLKLKVEHLDRVLANSLERPDRRKTHSDSGNRKKRGLKKAAS